LDFDLVGVPNKSSTPKSKKKSEKFSEKNPYLKLMSMSEIFEFPSKYILLCDSVTTLYPFSLDLLSSAPSFVLRPSSFPFRDLYKLIVSPDGEIRAADIRTSKGKTNRPVSKLYPLEVTETIETSPSSPSPHSPIIDSPSSRLRPRRKAALAAKERIRNMAQE
jgi:hypothetical protein